MRMFIYGQARALYEFESGGGGELGFKADEILTILRQDVGDGWWEAQNSRGETGLIPEAYMEVLSLPEPTMPPPPPPSTFRPPVPASNMRPTTLQTPVPPPTNPSWQQPEPEHNDYSANDGQLKSQDSYDDWDDDWDDDDSSTTTETPSEMTGGNFAHSNTNRDKGSKDGESAGGKFGTVKKSFNRFSAFNKQGGDAYLFGTFNAPVSEADRIVIMETQDGPMWKPADHMFTCQLASPKKESKYHGMKSYIAYQVTPSFSNIQVSRRYKHFDWLHERLLEKYSTVVVPPLPDKQIAGRYEDDFINERMRQLQLWVDRMCRHPVIAKSDVLHHFLSCTDEKRWKQGKRKAEKDEFQGGKFFLVITTPPHPIEMKDVDDTLDRFTRFVKSMDDSVRHLCSVGENNMKKHYGPFKKEYGKLGNSFISLARSFEFDDRPSSKKLTNAIHHTGKTYEDIGALYEEQPRHDMLHLLEGLHEYKGILSVFPDILAVQKVATQKMEESYTKMTETEAESVQGRIDVISYATVAEINHFNHYRTGDFKSTMQKYLKGQIQFYQKITAMLQTTLAQYEDA